MLEVVLEELRVICVLPFRLITDESEIEGTDRMNLQ